MNRRDFSVRSIGRFESVADFWNGVLVGDCQPGIDRGVFDSGFQQLVRKADTLRSDDCE